MWIPIVSDKAKNLSRQVYEQIRTMIFSGRLRDGEKLPSSRALAAQLGVSRTTVVDAYGQLIAEGYLEAQHGSGTRVASDVHRFTPNEATQIETIEKMMPINDPPGIDFRTGRPNLSLFPRKTWSRLYQEVCTSVPDDAIGYGSTFGVWALREAIADYLYRVRGLVCTPEQVMITSGSTQALSLVSQLLKRPGYAALVEDPTHPGLRRVIGTSGCEVRDIAADTMGLQTELLQAETNISFTYVTPSHQYPLGGILPIQRRLALIEFAETQNAYIVEDDYDSEFRYEGHPVSTMHELCPDRVIYLGSFSKTLAPGLRLGYAVLPPSLVDSCRELKAYTDVHTDALSQHTLARFLENGGYEKHVWRMKKHYQKMRACLLDALKAYVRTPYEIIGQASGLHLVVQLRDVDVTPTLVDTIAQRGVRIYSTQDMYQHKCPQAQHQMLLGYGHLSPTEIETGIKTVGQILSEEDVLY